LQQLKSLKLDFCEPIILGLSVEFKLYFSWLLADVGDEEIKLAGAPKPGQF
jgi:hypothetical protein